MTTPTSQRTLKKLLIGEDGSTTLRFKGASQLVSARALEVQRDSDGNPTYVCLDRLIHKPHEEALRADTPDAQLASVEVSGCVATEMHLVWMR